MVGKNVNLTDFVQLERLGFYAVFQANGLVFNNQINIGNMRLFQGVYVESYIILLESERTVVSEIFGNSFAFFIKSNRFKFLFRFEYSIAFSGLVDRI